MIRFVGLVAHKAARFVTRRILRDALASAIVTIVMTAAFTGFATRSEPPMPPAVAFAAVPQPEPQPQKAEVAATGPAQDAMKVWLDPKAVTPNPKGFQLPAARQASRKRSIVAARPAAAPISRAPAQMLRSTPLVLTSVRADDKALGHRRAPDALAMAAPASEKRGFRVWGVAPGDLIPSVPSASSIVRGVKSVGSSVVSWIPSL